MPEKTGNKSGGEVLKYVIVFAILFAIGIFTVWGITGQFFDTQPEKPEFVEQGDLVRINFTAWHKNGSFFESGMVEFRAGSGILVMKSIGEALLGMKVNESRILNLTPEYAFGEYDPQLIISQPRVVIMNSTITFATTPEQFNQTFRGMPEEGMIVSSVQIPWRRVEILDFTNTTMTWKLMPPEGLKTGWPFECYSSDLTATTETDCYGAVTMRVIEDGERIEYKIEPFTGERVNIGGAWARVLGGDNESIYLDFNHELAGMGFIYHVELLELEKA